MSSDPEESLDDEALELLAIQELEREQAAILAEKKERARLRMIRRILCCQRLCCFEDEEKRYNLDDKLPSYTQISCWRFLRARRRSHDFHTGPDALISLEKSSRTTAVKWLISFNYLLLYAVVIVPFVLILLHDEVESVEVDGVEVSCEVAKEACEDKEAEYYTDLNSSVLAVNAGVLVYSVICELAVVCSSIKATNTKCNSYLLCQVLTGLTMRAVILISAQLIAVFVAAIDLANFVLGIVLLSTLVLSQIRAVQIWLASIKQDKNCLLPKVQQNLRICSATNYLAAATLYKKVQVEASENAFSQTKALEDERENLMTYNFADEDGTKNKATRKARMKARLAKCRCCRWGSPKFYQMIMNDIPLILCLPFAYLFGLLDPVNFIVGLTLTTLDLAFMLFYLSYDEELSIDAQGVFELTEQRLITQLDATLRLLNDDEDSKEDEDADEEDPGVASGGGQDSIVVEDPASPGENEILGTENYSEMHPNSTHTIAFEASGPLPLVGALDQDSKRSNDQQDDQLVTDSRSQTRRGGTQLPPIKTASSAEPSNEGRIVAKAKPGQM